MKEVNFSGHNIILDTCNLTRMIENGINIHVAAENDDTNHISHVMWFRIEPKILKFQLGFFHDDFYLARTVTTNIDNYDEYRPDTIQCERFKRFIKKELTEGSMYLLDDNALIEKLGFDQVNIKIPEDVAEDVLDVMMFHAIETQKNSRSVPPKYLIFSINETGCWELEDSTFDYEQAKLVRDSIKGNAMIVETKPIE